MLADVLGTPVQEFLDHKTLTITLRYAHRAPSHQVKAAGYRLFFLYSLDIITYYPTSSSHRQNSAAKAPHDINPIDYRL
jgi:hypothetical protein